jgi:putative N6-adenine-specific DNA methylase
MTIAEENAKRATIGDAVEWSCANLFDLQAQHPHGLIVTNPPYGVRLEELDDLSDFYPAFASWLKQRMGGWSLHCLTADDRIQKLMRLREHAKNRLFNGALSCHLYHFDIVSGSHRKEKTNDDNPAIEA